ncbi:response regulator transcription factor [Mesotoga sp. H07.pep.5.3]|uniref:response regulator transcription factor n=1 Tax=Mesotoga sp. H07.pep.5.3 TaxID=1421003 RepID=UPI000C181560|nr:response regulator transcription factor [Mesotoga sp. H07.pep.5.3]PIJ63578.1 transcriptional regulator [Mesotoga sp. H07.pep.5.3]
MKILIVDDDLDILNIVRTACENESMQTSTAANAEELWSSLRSEKPDVILLDIMLPDANGLDLVKKIRTMYSRIPIIFLTARKSDLDMILGLELGADDYVTKPFNPRALVARIKAVMRRTEISGTLEDKLTIGDAVVNLKSYTVTKNGKSEELTRREFELLKLLAENPGRVFTREELLDKVWGMDFFGDFRTVDVHISKLREKVGEGFIKTVRGVGYKFVIGEQR